MPSIFETYQTKKSQIMGLAIPTKDKVWTGITAFLMALAIVIGPIVMIVNCFIFVDYLTWIIIGVIVCFYFLILLTRIFYIKGITQKQVENLTSYFLVEAILCFVIVFVLGIILVF